MKPKYCSPLVAISLLLTGTGALWAAESPTYVWFEAENTATLENGQPRNFPETEPEGRVFSEATALYPGNPDGPKMKATWEVELPESGDYNLWVRKFWRHGPFKWRFAGDDKWQECSGDIALHDDSYIRLHHGANWVFLGEVSLAGESVTLEVESIDNKGFLDCFLLIQGAFMPAGKLKPGEKANLAEEGYFAWEPEADPFEASPIDMRGLNEEYAGANGYVRREGDQFVLGNGEPVRFWMTQAGSLPSMKKPMIDLHARRLAKSGVNMVRLFFMDMFRTWRLQDEEKFKEQLDQVHYVVAALKREGIYTYFGHLFWDTHIQALTDNDLPGLRKGEGALGSLFFSEPIQERYLAFIRDLMTPKNPYTKVSLGEDPAVAVIEVMNESNLLFWTFNRDRIPGSTLEIIEKEFGKWAAEKYGSIEKAIEHWGQDEPGDDPANGRAGTLIAYFMTSEGIEQKPKRARDQIEFLTGVQRGLYEKMKAEFHQMGIRKMVAGSNWKTADPSTLGPLENYSYLTTDMVNKNDYYGPKKVEDQRGHAVDEGDVFVSLSAVPAPESAGPLMTAQPADHPFMITENNWDNPNEYRIEFPFLVATYGRMAGIDGWNFFAYDTPLWDTGMGVWNTNSPTIIGQWPGCALIYRRGDVKEGPVAVTQKIGLESLYTGQSIPLPEIQYKDFVWQALLGGDPKVEYTSEISPRAFFTGPVRIQFSNDDRSEAETVDLSKLIDEEKGIIYNTNEQLRWEYKRGIVTVDTETSQGVVGFLKKADTVKLSDVQIASENEYAAVLTVSLDGKPLPESARVLIQAGTQDKPYGYTLEKAGEEGEKKITSLGGYPFNVKKIKAQVFLKGHAGKTAKILDENGYPTGETAQAETRNGSLLVTLPEDSLYTIIE